MNKVGSKEIAFRMNVYVALTAGLVLAGGVGLVFAAMGTVSNVWHPIILEDVEICFLQIWVLIIFGLIAFMLAIFRYFPLIRHLKEQLNEMCLGRRDDMDASCQQAMEKAINPSAIETICAVFESEYSETPAARSVARIMNSFSINMRDDSSSAEARMQLRRIIEVCERLAHERRRNPELFLSEVIEIEEDGKSRYCSPVEIDLSEHERFTFLARGQSPAKAVICGIAELELIANYAVKFGEFVCD